MSVIPNGLRRSLWKGHLTPGAVNTRLGVNHWSRVISSTFLNPALPETLPSAFTYATVQGRAHFHHSSLVWGPFWSSAKQLQVRKIKHQSVSLLTKDPTAENGEPGSLPIQLPSSLLDCLYHIIIIHGRQSHLTLLLEPTCFFCHSEPFETMNSGFFLIFFSFIPSLRIMKTSQ